MAKNGLLTDKNGNVMQMLAGTEPMTGVTGAAPGLADYNAWQCDVPVTYNRGGGNMLHPANRPMGCRGDTSFVFVGTVK